MAGKLIAQSSRRADVSEAVPQPPRRSIRIMKQQPFRFRDLPPGLRNTVYAYALADYPERLHGHELRELTGCVGQNAGHVIQPAMSETAKTLSQLSRATRVESLEIYYAQNMFNVAVQDTALARKSIRRVAEWAAMYGQVAAPRLRSLSTSGLFWLKAKSGVWSAHRLLIRTTHPTKPLLISPLEEGERLSPHISEAQLDALVLAILRPQGKLELTAERIRMLLTALHLIPASFGGLNAKQTSTLLAKLATEAGQKEIISRCLKVLSGVEIWVMGSLKF